MKKLAGDLVSAFNGEKLPIRTIDQILALQKENSILQTRNAEVKQQFIAADQEHK